MSSDLANGDASGLEQPRNSSWTDAGLGANPMPAPSEVVQFPPASAHDLEAPAGPRGGPERGEEGRSGTPGPREEQNEFGEPTDGDEGASEGANGRAKTADTTELSDTDPDLELDDVPAPDDDSDFAAEETPLDSDVSEPLSDYDSDDSGRPKRKGKVVGKKRKERTPPDNEMTRKLRNRAEDADTSGREDGGQDGEEGSDEDFDDGRPKVLERHVTLAEEEEQQLELQQDWQMADVLHFIIVFLRDIPGLLHMQWTANAVESNLITSTGGPGLLATLHMEVLRTLLPRGATMTVENWTMYFANVLKRQWREWGMRGDPPFAPAKGDEAITYCNLPTEERLLALKALCEARLDRDLHDVVEDAIKPPRLPKPSRNAPPPPRGSKAPPPLRTLDDFRMKPLGRDSSGFVFYWLDLGPAGTRLYKETPVRLLTKQQKALQGKRGRAGEPGWELTASNVEELQALGVKVQRSRDKNDQSLAAAILDTIVPTLAARVAEEERKAKAAARLRLQLNTIIPDSQGGFGRPRRARKEVSYTFENYDNMIRSAMRSEKPSRDSTRSRRHASPPKPSAEEEARAGLRRGRSAAGVAVPEHDEGDEHEDDQGNSDQEHDDRDDHGQGDDYGGRGTPEPARIPRKTRTPRPTPTPDGPSRAASRAPPDHYGYDAPAPQSRAGSGPRPSGGDAHEREADRPAYPGSRDEGYPAWNGQGMGQGGYGGGGYGGPNVQYAAQRGFGNAGWQGSAGHPSEGLPQVGEEEGEEDQ